jgi:hypothetical protein
MLYDAVRSNKNQPPWLGPYTIVRVSALGLYTLRDFAGGIFHRDVTRDQLKVVEADDLKSGELQTHYVDRILKHRNRNGKREYLIAWADCLSPTWEPAENLDDLESLTRDYFSNLSRVPRAPRASTSSQSAPVDPVPAPSPAPQQAVNSQPDRRRRSRAPVVSVPAVSPAGHHSSTSPPQAHPPIDDAHSTRRSRQPSSRLRDSVVF